jgi:drug/metabolite transporter (DMT)-like permease
LSIRAPSQPIQAALWMIATGILLAAMTAMIRPAAAGLHPFEVAFLRAVIGSALVVGWLWRAGLPLLPRERRLAYGARALLDSFSMALWFLAVTLIPLATATALLFTMPIFATMLAALLLREVVHARRWAAIAAGFTGALIILRPDGGALATPALMVLGTAVTAAGARILVRPLARTERPGAITSYHMILQMPFLLVPALLVWRWPDADAALWLLGLSVTGVLTHMCLARALSIAEASAVAPYDFVQLVAAALIGYLAFGEVLDPWTALGGAIITAAALYIARRESRSRREEKRR